MKLLIDAGWLAGAHLRVEFRDRSGMAASAAIGALGLILVALAAGPDVARLRALAPGLMWLGLLYAAIALADRLHAALRVNDAHTGFWLAVTDRRSIYLGSVAALAVLLGGLALALALLASVLMDLPLGLADVPILLLACALAALGAAAVAALVSVLVGASPQRALLGPVILLPLLTPVLLAGSGVMRSLMDPASSSPGGWLALLGIEAGFFTGIGLLTYEAAAAPE